MILGEGIWYIGTPSQSVQSTLRDGGTEARERLITADRNVVRAGHPSFDILMLRPWTAYRDYPEEWIAKIDEYFLHFRTLDLMLLTASISVESRQHAVVAIETRAAVLAREFGYGDEFHRNQMERARALRDERGAQLANSSAVEQEITRLGLRPSRR